MYLKKTEMNGIYRALVSIFESGMRRRFFVQGAKTKKEERVKGKKAQASSSSCFV